MEILPNNIYNMDCIEGMQSIPDNSIDAIVTDPPYELGFMGKSWDKSGIANNVEMWKEALRILKPGGHLLAFSGTRTYHRMVSAIEDAGFEVRDMIEWVYGSGFPKSLNIGKVVDKLQGNEREVVGKKIDLSTGRPMSAKQAKAGNGKNINKGWDRPWRADDKHCEDMTLLTKGTSEWEGWGTALKPSHESICMARKPISEKTVAENCLKYGTGGINIDESRVVYQSEQDKPSSDWYSKKGGVLKKEKQDGFIPVMKQGQQWSDNPLGRFPANLIHDNSEEVRECFPEYTKSTGGSGEKFNIKNRVALDNNSLFPQPKYRKNGLGLGDSGNASRYFKSIIYIPKASKSERNRGCEGLEEKQYSHDGREKEIENPYQRNKSVANNNHPTVKPIALMEYLINMITREGQTVLDPFLGSGTTAVACIQTNRRYIGFELLPEYFQIAQKRIDKAIEDSNTLFINYSKNSSSSN